MTAPIDVDPQPRPTRTRAAERREGREQIRAAQGYRRHRRTEREA